ncbi:hypothetical protein QUB10_16910 [Microcoleus sp. B5-D4]|uniref:hypothetical protein n=1 Tax=unclassified Microcoleus TaxID=2642155 RepID=UPI002FCFCD06
MTYNLNAATAYRFFISPRMNPGACILDAFGYFKAVEPSILIFDGPFPDITEPREMSGKTA